MLKCDPIMDVPPSSAVRSSSRCYRIWSAAALLAFLLCFGGCANRERTAIECRLKPRGKEFAPRVVLSAHVHHLQGDIRWATHQIGGSGKPLYAVGCTVCCLSMALAQ